MDHYLELTRQAARDALEQEASIDLMVWPEGAFRVPLYSYPPEYATPELQKAAAYAPNDLKSLQQLASAPLLVGLDRIHFTDPNSAEIYNACAAVDDEGQLLGTYDKTHLVMFGEYVPLTDLWPGLYDYFPIGGVTPGREPAAFDIGGVRYMPTICYETTIPHVVREQVAQLTAAQARPDVLVNITNDSWFYDSSELRMHLACSRLRAIECRTPLVAAANGGLSANIDCCGRVLAVSQAMQPQVLLVDVVPGGHDSPYLGHGDAFAIGSLVVTLVISIAGGVIARKSKKAPPTKAIG